MDDIIMSESNSPIAPSWFIQQVFSDPDFNKDLLDAVLGEARPSGYFQSNYLIPDSLIHSEFVVDEQDAPSNAGVFGLSATEHTINIKLSKNVTKQEYLASWKLVQWYKQNRLGLGDSKTKRKQPQYPDLLYAVYKARHLGKPLTFRQIFELYSDGKLPHYDKKAQPFKTEESLERYYRQYTPKQ